ncbi:unnamed protein product, partial [Brassica rapa]
TQETGFRDTRRTFTFLFALSTDALLSFSLDSSTKPTVSGHLSSNLISRRRNLLSTESTVVSLGGIVVSIGLLDEEDAEERDYENSEDDDENHGVERYGSSSSVFDFSASHSGSKHSKHSGLPSAKDVYSQISGPPEFLNNRIEADEEATARDAEHTKRLTRKRKKAKLKAGFVGVVVEEKPQLVGIHERVRNDIDAPPPSSENGEKRISTATNPNAEEVADLLRMCLQCGVPKTYTSTRGMVCPVCGDRPLPDSDAKKRGSAIKDKEKSKRMRGQSSHASWKSNISISMLQNLLLLFYYIVSPFKSSFCNVTCNTKTSSTKLLMLREIHNFFKKL